MKNKNYCEWKTKEVKELFAFIESYKEKNLPLTFAFNQYAKQSERKPNSVRNYYYLELSELERNKRRRVNLDIDLTKHTKQKFREFTKEEEYKMAFYILQKNREGKSVRKSCLELSKNDVNEMIRYQNKFRSLIKNKASLIEEINKKLDVTMGVKGEFKTSNVLNFPASKSQVAKNKLTDEELKGLFMGLVKLVKKSASLEIANSLKQECSFANENLRKTLVAMRQKQEEIAKLSSVNKELSEKVKQLEDKLIDLRVQAVKNINKKLNTKNKS